MKINTRKPLPGKTPAQKDRAARLLKSLYRHYPHPHCALIFTNPFELLVATILSAQCTDARVNMVTKDLFRNWPTPAEMATAPLQEIEEVIRSTGFFRNKARSIKESAVRIIRDFNGRVPETMEELLTLRGAARKTANVVLGNAFGKNEGVVVDTHVGRLSRRFGLSRHDNPVKVERDLMALFDREEWTNLSHLLIAHGRNACKSRMVKPPVHPICQEFGVRCICTTMERENES